MWRAVVNKPVRSNLPIRILFFLGLVVVTIFLILMTIVDISSTEYLSIAKWAMLGFLTGCVFILMAIGHYFNLTDKLIRTEKEAIKKHTYLIGSAIVITMCCLVLAGLAISTMFGDNTFRALMIENVQLGILFIVTACTIYYLVISESGTANTK
jgi:cytochrome b561